MAVQEGSQSKRLGLVQGDQITQVGEKNTMNLSREEVLQALQATKSTFDTVVKYNHDGGSKLPLFLKFRCPNRTTFGTHCPNLNVLFYTEPFLFWTIL